MLIVIVIIIIILIKIFQNLSKNIENFSQRYHDYPFYTPPEKEQEWENYWLGAKSAFVPFSYWL